jgi:hypothetical protein
MLVLEHDLTPYMTLSNEYSSGSTLNLVSWIRIRIQVGEKEIKSEELYGFEILYGLF